MLPALTHLCLRAAAESPSSRRLPLPESLCFFRFFCRASSRWFPPARRGPQLGPGIRPRDEAPLPPAPRPGLTAEDADPSLGPTPPPSPRQYCAAPGPARPGPHSRVMVPLPPALRSAATSRTDPPRPAPAAPFKGALQPIAAPRPPPAALPLARGDGPAPPDWPRATAAVPPAGVVMPGAAAQARGAAGAGSAAG